MFCRKKRQVKNSRCDNTLKLCDALFDSLPKKIIVSKALLEGGDDR